MALGDSLGILDVHLVSGEDVIGDASYSLDGEELVIGKPVIPHVGFDPTSSRFNVAILPLRPYLGDVAELRISRDKVLFTLPVGPEMEAKYREFTSKIQLVPASALPPQLIRG